jgi:hypothetical protein
VAGRLQYQRCWTFRPWQVYVMWLWSSRNDFTARLERSHANWSYYRHVCACFNLHQLRFQRINASCAEVAVLLRRVCSYASLQKWVIGF